MKLSEILFMLSETLGHEMSPAAMKGYVLVLQDIDPALVLSAALHYMSQDNTRMPAPGKLRAIVGELTLRATGGRLSAGDAWELVMREMRNVGHWRDPELPETVLKAVNSMGGWQLLCFSETPMADRAHFLKIYDQIEARRTEDRNTLPAVRGHVDRLAAGMKAPQRLEG